MRRLGVVIAAVLMAVVPQPAQARDAELRVTAGYHYSTGDYGTDDTTEIMYAPLSVRGTLDAASLQVTVPYLRVTGGGTAQGPNGPVSATDADGLGDVLARVAYTIDPATAWLPWLDLIGSVKFPTADRGAGLGTGRFDFGIATDATWTIGRLTPFVGLGYRFLGSSPTLRLRNIVEANGGAQVRIGDDLHAGALVDWRQSASPRSRERFEIVPFVTYRASASWSMSGYVSAGLSSGSPAVGTGLTLAWKTTGGWW